MVMKNPKILCRLHISKRRYNIIYIPYSNPESWSAFRWVYYNLILPITIRCVNKVSILINYLHQRSMKGNSFFIAIALESFLVITKIPKFYPQMTSSFQLVHVKLTFVPSNLKSYSISLDLGYDTHTIRPQCLLHLLEISIRIPKIAGASLVNLSLTRRLYTAHCSLLQRRTQRCAKTSTRTMTFWLDQR